MANKCQECGFIHPYTPKGQCLVAKAKRMGESDKGKKILLFTNKLSELLNKSDDWEETIGKINNLLGI